MIVMTIGEKIEEIKADEKFKNYTIEVYAGNIKLNWEVKFDVRDEIMMKSMTEEQIEKFQKRKEKSVQRCLNRECNEIDISKLNEGIRLFV